MWALALTAFAVTLNIAPQGPSSALVPGANKTEVRGVSTAPARNVALWIQFSKLCEQKGLNILPRNGFLLGIARHGGLLPNEPVDMDYVVYEKDIPALTAADLTPFSLHLMEASKSEFKTDRWFDGRHPITGAPLPYIGVQLLVHGKKLGSGQVLYDYKENQVFLPAWVSSSNAEKEYQAHMRYNEHGGGNMLLGDPVLEIKTLKNLTKADSHYGKAGTVYLKENWFPPRKMLFYQQEVLVPHNIETVVAKDYGTNAMTSMLDKETMREQQIPQSGLPPLPLDGPLPSNPLAINVSQILGDGTSHQ